jgi:hypothetical protein
MDLAAGSPTGVNPIDLAAVAIVVVGFVLGLRSGFFPQLGGLAGEIGGRPSSSPPCRSSATGS